MDTPLPTRLPKQRWAYLFPLLSATIVLVLISFFGFREQAKLSQSLTDQAIVSLAQTATAAKTNLAKNLEMTQRSIVRYAGRLEAHLNELTEADIERLALVFDERYRRDADGVIRSPQSSFNPAIDAGVLVPPSTPLTAENKAFFVVSEQISNVYGNGALSSPFMSTYILPSINGIVLFWPSQPRYIYEAGADFNYLATEWVTLTSPEHNPEKQMRWTSALYDLVTDEFMISAVAPVYFKDRWYGSVGHDLGFESLVSSLKSLEQIPGSRYVLAKDDGMILLSGAYAEDIKLSKGMAHIDQLADPTLLKVWPTRSQAHSGQVLEINGDAVFVEYLPEQQWWIFNAVPMAPVLNPIHESFSHLRFSVLLVILLEVFAALGLLYWLHRRTRLHIQELQSVQHQLIRLNHGLEQEVTERTEALSATVKELESFNFVVSHDLRAPLRHINAFLQSVIEDEENQLSPQSQKFVERCVSAVNRLNLQINEIMNFARLGKSAMFMQSVDLRQLIEELQSELSVTYPKAVWQIESLPTLSGDKTLLRQLFLNLLDNACKYSSKHASPQIRVSSEQEPDDSYRIVIQDNGVGFDPAGQEKLFQLFQRLHRAEDFSGTGVGLATCAKIVLMHGGNLQAESEPGHGARFIVNWPANPS